MSRHAPRPPLFTSPREPNSGPELSPNDHLRLLVGLLRPAGPELARRWLAALLLTDPPDRPRLVEEIERRVTQARTPSAPPPEVHVVHPPVAREGYVEQVHVTYRPRASEGSTPSTISRRRRAR